MTTQLQRDIVFRKIDNNGKTVDLKRDLHATAKYERGYWSINCPDLDIFCVSSDLDDAKQQVEDLFIAGMENYWEKDEKDIPSTCADLRSKYQYYIEGRNAESDENDIVGDIFNEQKRASTGKEYLVQFKTTEVGDWMDYNTYTDKTEAIVSLRYIQKAGVVSSCRLMTRTVSDWREYCGE